MPANKHSANYPVLPADEKIVPQQEGDLSKDPVTPPSEDIYNQQQQQQDIDPEDTSAIKEPNEATGMPNEKDFNEDVSGDDLDIPGGELDDAEEAIGSEDEENNYYSVGGDNHNNLDEDRD